MKWRDLWLVTVVLALCACATPSTTPNDVARTELAPYGKLRFGVVAGPERTEFFVVMSAGGQPEGVTVDLGRELAHKLGVPVEFKVASSAWELTELLMGGKIDAAILTPDKVGRQRLDFGTSYFEDRGTFMVRAGSRIGTIDD